MERRVKERLVGATVLVAAAVILIPEMLSGPEAHQRHDGEAGSDEPFKTYTIDLNRSPGAPAAASQTTPQPAPVEEAAPPPETEPSQVTTEQPASAPDSESPAEEPARNAQASRIRNSTARTTSADRSRRTRAEPAPSPREERAPSAQTGAAIAARCSLPAAPLPKAVPTSRGWAVQLGSFASRQTADRIAKEFSGFGADRFCDAGQVGHEYSL